MTRSISKKQTILNKVYSLVAEYGRQDEILLIKFLLEAENPETGKRFTSASIAKKLGISRQALHDRYPELTKGSKK